MKGAEPHRIDLSGDHLLSAIWSHYPRLPASGAKHWFSEFVCLINEQAQVLVHTTTCEHVFAERPPLNFNPPNF